MKGAEKIFGAFLLLVFLFCPFGAHAKEPTLAELQREIISTWLVTVEGEDRTRTLKITGSAQKSGDILLLEAIYGWSDGNQTSISGSLVVSESGARLLLNIAT